MERVLARKHERALLQEEWREARALRREKFSRIILETGVVHQRTTFRSALSALCEQYVREQFPRTSKNYYCEDIGPKSVSELENIYFDKISENNMNSLKFKYLNKRKDFRIARAQMMAENADAQGDGEAKVEKQPTAEHQEQSEVSVASSLPSKTHDNEFKCLAATTARINDDSFTDRYVILKEFTWTSASKENDEVVDISLPKDFLENEDLQDTPNFAPFSRHTYWAGDMDLKITINSNIRQFGQLQFSFYYAADFDRNYEYRNNIYSNSQRTHALITANFANEADLEIPFQWINPVLPISKGVFSNKELKTNVRTFASLGRLSGRVVVPLEATATTDKEVDVTVWIAFKNNVFSGMIPRSINMWKGQMFSLNNVMKVIETVDNIDFNRDNPTLHSVGTPMIPINSSSWCQGKGTADYSNILRLDPNCQLPYAGGRTPKLDEMSVDYVTRIFGMLPHIEWNDQQRRGVELARFFVSPVLPNSEYPKILRHVEGEPDVNTYVMNPLGVVGSLFSYWRGSLNLRIDIVGCTELQGSLLIAYVPNYGGKLTLTQAQGCAYAKFNIKENRQINFKIPFLSDKLFWPSRYSLSADYPVNPNIAQIRIFIQQKLVANSTIPGKAILIPYLSGGDDFAVSVPRAPLIGLGFNPVIYTRTAGESYIIIKDGYEGAYPGTWRWATDYVPTYGIECYLPVLRYGSISDHIVQWEVFNCAPYIKTIDKTKIECNYLVGKINKLGKSFGTDFKIVSTYDDAKDVETTFTASHLIGWFSNGYIYALPITIDQFNLWEANFKNSSNPQGFYATGDALHLWTQTFVDFWLKGDKTLKSFYVKASNSWTNLKFAGEYVKLVEAQMPKKVDERVAIKSKPAEPQITACGAKSPSVQVFGESFRDLKDLCRRYQLYCYNDFRLAGVKEGQQRVMLRVPVMPQGLNLDIGTKTQIKDYWNRSREGPIGIIASGYRFFTGGIRFRLVINVVSVEGRNQKRDINVKVFIQHRPDLQVTHETPSINTQVLSTLDLSLPGYAYYNQFDNINNVISVEVPFYLPTLRGFLQRPSSEAEAVKWSGLGELSIGISIPLIENCQISYELYYALADDARFSVFTGFPPVIYTNTIPAERPTYHILEEGEEDDLFEDLSDSCVKIHDVIEYQKPANAQMFGFLKAADNFNKLDIDSVNETVNQSKDMIQSIKDTISNVVPTLVEAKDKMMKYVDVLINAVTNLAHVIANFNLKSIGIAIVSFLTKLKVVSINSSTAMLNKIKELFDYLSKIKGVPNELNEGSTPKGQMSLEDTGFAGLKLEKDEKLESNVFSGYVSTLIAGVASLLSIIPKLCKSKIDKCGDILMDGLKNFTWTANGLFTFIKNNLECIKRIGRWLIHSQPSVKDVAFLGDIEDEFLDWAKEVITITNPRLEDKVFSNLKLASKVYLLAAQAGVIQLKLIGVTNLNPKQSNVILKLCGSIEKLRERLAKIHMAPPVRFEPFVYELTGKSGIGKSELMKEIPYKLLKHLNIKTSREVIYHRTCGNPYWNNLYGQPVCSIDDKFPVDGPNFTDVQLSELFQLKSSCVFNPPMADLPDKNIRYNPLIVQYASNNAFPSLPAARDKEAVFRRRDELVEVCMRADLIDKYSENVKYMDLAKEDRKNFNHLEFRFYRDVCDNKSLETKRQSYEEFIESLCRRFKCFYDNEEKKFRKNMLLSTSLIPECEAEEFKLFETNWLERLEEKLAVPEPDREYRDKVNEAYVEFKNDKNKPKLINKIVNSCKKIFKIKSEDDLEKEALGEKPKAQMLVGHPACPHAMMDWIIREEGQCHFDFNIKYNSWQIDHEAVDTYLSAYATKDDPDDVPMMCNNAFCGGKIDMRKTHTSNSEPDLLYEMNNQLRILHSYKVLVSDSPCDQHSGYGDNCVWKRQLRTKFILQYIRGNSTLTTMFENGVDMSEFIPQDFFLSYMGKDEEFLKPTQEQIKKVSWIKGKFHELKEQVMDIQWLKWMKRIAIVVGLFAFISSCFFAYQYMTTGSIIAGSNVATCGETLANTALFGISLGKLEEAKAEGHASGDFKVSGTKTTVKGVAKRLLEEKTFMAQMGDPQMDALVKSLRRNTFSLCMVSNGRKLQGRCLGVCGRSALVPSHYMEAWKSMLQRDPSAEFYIITTVDKSASMVPIRFCDIHKKSWTESSLSLLTMPKNIIFKDIRVYLARAEDHSKINYNGQMMELCFDENKKNFDFQLYYLPFEDFHDLKVAEEKDMWRDFTVKDGYAYKGFSAAGKCGSVLVTQIGGGPKIIGMHVAGYSDTKDGFSDLVYREMVEHLKADPSVLNVPGTGQMSHHFVDAHVIGIGRVSKELAHRANSKSRIMKSFLRVNDKENRFPVYTDVAVLGRNDPRIPEEEQFSPMLEGCKFHGKPLIPFNAADVDLAVKDLKLLILSKCKPQRKSIGLLSEKDAIAGIPGLDGYEHLEWRSSEGYPFVGLRPPGKKDKKWLFEFDEAGIATGGVHPYLRSVLDCKWQQRLDNSVPSTIFTDCLKDCTVDLEKVLKPGKTRIFAMAPVDLTIQERQCSLDFVVAYMACRRNLEHQIGINPDSFEWAQLTADLLSKGNKIVTGDYSKFGDTIPFEFILAAFEIISDWYKFNNCNNEQLYQQLKIMAYEVGLANHLMFDHVYKVVCGQPSGNSLTVIINSIANSLYIRCAWLSIMRNTNFSSLKELSENVALFSYGDDLIMGVSDEVIDYFNGVTLQEFFGKHNLKFTNADKSDQMVAYTNLFQADFLKRGFRPHPTRVAPRVMLAPLAIASIEDTVNWVWADSFGNKDPLSRTYKELSLQICQSAGESAFGRGPEYYEQFNAKIADFWIKHGELFRYPTWEQLDIRVFENNYTLCPHVKRFQSKVI